MEFESLDTPEALTKHVETLLQERKIDDAVAAVSIVEEKFPDSAVALHLAGVVFERAYLELNAEGQSPSLVYYEKAEQYFRKALELDPEHMLMHSERLYTCLFVVGTQKGDLAKLQESYEIANVLSQSDEELIAENYKHEKAIIRSGIARITGDVKDWLKAEEEFEELECPNSGREKYFFCYYKGMVKRTLSDLHEDQGLLIEAIHAFRGAMAESRIRTVEYLLADCLIQLEQPDPVDQSEMKEYVLSLTNRFPNDPLITKLFERWQVRLRLLETPRQD